MLSNREGTISFVPGQHKKKGPLAPEIVSWVPHPQVSEGAGFDFHLRFAITR
jgi:hypothetical protein